MESTSPRRAIRKLEVMVAEVVRETEDATTLVLFTGNDHLEYKPGHFITIDPHQFSGLARWTHYLEDKKGKRETPRAYSLASAPHHKHLAITVKEERYISGTTPYPPLLSPYLHRFARRGTRMEITGFAGPYTLPQDIESRTQHIVHVTAGSGIVPNFSILRHALETGMNLRHTLVYGNRTLGDMIYRKPLADLAGRYPDRLRVIHALSRDPEAVAHGPEYRSGRVSEELLQECIPHTSDVEVFLCGPGITKHQRAAARKLGDEPAPRFLESSLLALRSIGVPKERIHRESYG